MARPFGWKRLAWCCLALLAFAGCEGKRIENLGGIRSVLIWDPTDLLVRINLMTDTGQFLTWESDAVTAASAGVLPIEELDTRIRIHSMRDGQRHQQVFSGRLKALQWNAQFIGTFRELLGVVPTRLIEFDQEADGPIGEVDVTLITPKQGSFHTTIYDAVIYAPQLFPTIGGGEEF